MFWARLRNLFPLLGLLMTLHPECKDEIEQLINFGTEDDMFDSLK